MALVLDDNVVRSLGHGEVGVGPFVALRDEGVSIHLADGAMTELVHQLLERRFRWQNWLVAREALLKFLDQAEPILLGGRQGLYRAGVRGATQNVTAEEIAIAVTRSTGWWEAFVRAESLGEVTQSVRVGGDVLGLSAHVAERAVASFKNEWVRSFDKLHIGEALLADVHRILPRRSDGIQQLDEVVKTIARSLDKAGRGNANVRTSVRLDGMIRVYVLLQLRSMRPVEPYNADRHQNDSFDHDLLRYLAYPAALCTRDGGITRMMRSAKCWQTPWVVQPNELATPFGRRQVREIAWPVG
jgi:hypothetical protein